MNTKPTVYPKTLLFVSVLLCQSCRILSTNINLLAVCMDARDATLCVRVKEMNEKLRNFLKRAKTFGKHCRLAPKLGPWKFRPERAPTIKPVTI